MRPGYIPTQEVEQRLRALGFITKVDAHLRYRHNRLERSGGFVIEDGGVPETRVRALERDFLAPWISVSDAVARLERLRLTVEVKEDTVDWYCIAARGSINIQTPDHFGGTIKVVNEEELKSVEAKSEMRPV